jgi:hypothetical protein
MNIIIEIDGVLRRYNLDQDSALNKDWNEVVADIIDTINKVNNL